MHLHQSVWAATAIPPDFLPLTDDLRVEVCVVGAGIAGLSTAYLLAKAGKSVAVLDDGPIGGGMTQMTTGHLVNMMDDRYFELEAIHGVQGARLAAQSHSDAIDRIESIVALEKIDCDFSRLDGFLFLADGDEEATLDKELQAAHRAGLHAVTKLDRAPFTSFDSGPCLRFPQVAQFHALKYLAGLAKAIRRDGGRIFTGSHAEGIKPGTPARVRCGSHTVTADAVVVATNVPVNSRFAIHTKQAPYMTYVIGARVPRGSVPKILSWDTGDPYHYVRLQAMGDDDLLIVGGEDHKSGQANDGKRRQARLEAWARERFPMMGPLEFAWGGQIMETVDYLAFIGRSPMDDENVFVATGDSGMGLTHGTIAAIIISDSILGRQNRWAKLYNASRKPIGAAREYGRENLNVARQYAQWLTPGEVEGVEEIARDDGAVLRRGLSKIAVYRDSMGAVHASNAACPHLGCIVHWNRSEKTWDCPCHGSRFDRFGKVMNGPANRDLAKVSRRRSARARRPVWVEVLLSGLAAGVGSALVASAFTRRNYGHAARAMNSVAHIYDGEPTPAKDAPARRNTAIGSALHLAASVGWAALFEGIFGNRARADAPAALAGGACVAATAYVVDYHVVPKRLRPGFEEHLTPSQMFCVYTALAAGFALPVVLSRLRGHQIKNADER